MTSEELAWKIRRDVLEMIHKSNAQHIGPVLSVTDIIAVLYNDIMTTFPDDPKNDKRDRLILSKGHAGAAIYAALAEKGFIESTLLEGYYSNGSPLSGHVSHKGVPGIEFSTGSLGHGACVATGMAMAAQLDHKEHYIYAILGDGECDEGSIWETALFASHHQLNHLVFIIDHNKLQGLDSCENVLNLGDLAEKWRVFNWNVIEVDGHNHKQLKEALNSRKNSDKPTCIIAHTIKGKGISFMENKVAWHFRAPQGRQYQKAVEELEGQKDAQHIH